MLNAVAMVFDEVGVWYSISAIDFWQAAGRVQDQPDSARAFETAGTAWCARCVHCKVID